MTDTTQPPVTTLLPSVPVLVAKQLPANPTSPAPKNKPAQEKEENHDQA
jgi:hypothetical protein